MGLKKSKPLIVDLYAYLGIHDAVIDLWQSLRTSKIANQTMINLIQHSIRSGAYVSVSAFANGVEKDAAKRVPIRLSINRDKYPIVVDFWGKLETGFASGIFLLLIQKALDDGVDIEMQASDFFRHGEEVVLHSRNTNIEQDSGFDSDILDYGPDENHSAGSHGVSIGDLFKEG